MTVKPELMKRIREHFSLNIYETKVWIALLGKGIATAGEIAEMSNVPRSRTYDVLESLEKQGFAILKLGKPVKYIAVDPGVVVERLKTNITREAEERSNALAKIKDTEDYKQIDSLHKQGITPVSAEELSGMIKGRSNIYNQIKTMISNAKKEVLISISANEIRSKKFQNLVNGKKVKAKIVTNASDEDLKGIDVNAKSAKLNGRFCIVDEKEALFMITPDSNDEDSDYAIWVNSPYFIQTLSNMFNLAWEK
jgi:sugar-specific transcriptional regulator TrmB